MLIAAGHGSHDARWLHSRQAGRQQCLHLRALPKLHAHKLSSVLHRTDHAEVSEACKRAPPSSGLHVVAAAIMRIHCDVVVLSACNGAHTMCATTIEGREWASVHAPRQNCVQECLQMPRSRTGLHSPTAAAGSRKVASAGTTLRVCCRYCHVTSPTGGERTSHAGNAAPIAAQGDATPMAHCRGHEATLAASASWPREHDNKLYRNLQKDVTPTSADQLLQGP